MAPQRDSASHLHSSNSFLNWIQENRLTTHVQSDPSDLQSDQAAFEHDTLQEAIKSGLLT